MVQRRIPRLARTHHHRCEEKTAKSLIAGARVRVFKPWPDRHQRTRAKVCASFSPGGFFDVCRGALPVLPQMLSTAAGTAEAKSWKADAGSMARGQCSRACQGGD